MSITTEYKVLTALNSVESGEPFIVTYNERNSPYICLIDCIPTFVDRLSHELLKFKLEAYDMISVWSPELDKTTGNGYKLIPLEGIYKIETINNIWEFK